MILFKIVYTVRYWTGKKTLHRYVYGIDQADAVRTFEKLYDATREQITAVQQA